MVSVVASVPIGNNPDGAVLMEPDGTVLGILDKSGVPAAGSGSVFLPGEFVVQVARELMSDGGHIVHGWLGIHGANPSPKQPEGALVIAVDKSGASDDYLRAWRRDRGDRWRAGPIDGRPALSAVPPGPGDLGRPARRPGPTPSARWACGSARRPRHSP